MATLPDDKLSSTTFRERVNLPASNDFVRFAGSVTVSQLQATGDGVGMLATRCLHEWR
jgi:hypothetical protein